MNTKILFFSLALMGARLLYANTAPLTIPSPPPIPVQTVENSEIENFYQITPTLYRSEQPNRDGFLELERRGIRSVLNLRNHHSDDDEARDTSIALYHLQTNAGDLTETDILMALTTLRAADKPILVHCWHGSDRTGTIIAAYRIVEEGWTVEAAIAELMEPRFGHHANFYKNIAALLRSIDWERLKARYHRTRLNTPATPILPYTTVAEPWPEALGSQRAVISIPRAAESIAVRIDWRRHDRRIDVKRFILLPATGEPPATPIAIQRLAVDSEKCELRVGPVKAGLYYLYYLPYTPCTIHGGFLTKYDPPETPAELPTAELTATTLRIESRTAHDSRFPMEVCATAAECAAYLTHHPAPYHLFGETRERSVRMRDALPAHWLAPYRSTTLDAGTARPNEYFCFQGALWASSQPLEHVAVRWSSFKTATGAKIPATAITCFTTEGIDPNGIPFKRQVSVPIHEVQSFWFGVDLPRDAAAGTYFGSVTFEPFDLPALTLPVTFTIAGDILEDRGDTQPEKMSRLRWLNSTFGITGEPIAPYTALNYSRQGTGDTISASTQGAPNRVTYGFTEGSPLPATLTVDGTSVLAAPMTLTIGDKPLDTPLSEVSSSEHATYYTNTRSNATCQTHCKIEFDGWLHFSCTFTSPTNATLPEVALTVPFTPATSQYFMGAGRPGGAMPESYTGIWGEGAAWSTPWDSFWVGSATAGLHVELLGATYHGPMLNLYRPAPPAAWYNQGTGRVIITNGTTRITTGGPVTVKAGKPLTFAFALQPTPVKPLNSHAQFTNRYYHNGGNPVPPDTVLTNGIKIINVHHANFLNPVINYPFLTLDRIRDFTTTWHEKGCKVKIYYTLREMTTAFPEIWAFRSLGTELLAGGRGGNGAPWLCEHLVTGYTPQWYAPLQNVLPEVGYDAAVLTSPGESRLLNYYIEGLRYIVKHTDIDGLYLDDVSFDRRMLKRMRRAITEIKPTCIIDLHSNTGFSHGPATQYYDFMPYIDKIWFGESFRYNELTPEAWLVEVSGIPFGHMGDMLQAGGNRWLGMLFGMTTRLPWSSEGNTAAPKPMWAYWDRFDIAHAEMLGWWNPKCPVRVISQDKTQPPPVRATVYRKADGSQLIALGNFSDNEQTVHLQFLDTYPEQLIQPAIHNFQPAATYPSDATLSLPPRQGLLLEAHGKIAHP